MMIPAIKDCQLEDGRAWEVRGLVLFRRCNEGGGVRLWGLEEVEMMGKSC